MVIEPDATSAPDPVLSQNAEFYQRVLQEFPSPMLVVDKDGRIMNGNRALELMGGWDLRAEVGNHFVGYIHPDDVQDVAEEFLELIEAADSDTAGIVPWPSIHTRLLAANGQILPVRVTGVGALTDPDVNGVIYDIRPAYEQDILRRSLTGLAQGEPIDAILQLITDMVALPPFGLDAAVLEPRGDGMYRIIGATNETLETILFEAHDPQPWNSASVEPQQTIISRFPGGVGEDLFAAGYREFWHVSPEQRNGPESYRIVAAGTKIQERLAGQIDRLSRANELAGVVLLRARADALLEHSATHDPLTQLANREGFQRRAAEVLSETTAETAALLFIDLDGFKQVNDLHGHAAGDQVLRTVAKRLITVTRSVDLVGRLGGDEFVVLVGASNDRPVNRTRVQVIVDRALQELRREIDIGDSKVTVWASIGAVIDPTPTTLEQLLAHADKAMYEAKNSGGNRHNVIEL